MKIGVIGAGGFGLYALQHFAQLPGVQFTGMAGTHREAALATAKRFGIPNFEDPDKLVQSEDVELVYIATPPFLHYEQSLSALRRGKHVICEKPLALTLEQADEMIGEARARGLCLIANLMQRYNPLFESVRQLILTNALGNPLHGYFENYASDESLGPAHWFWDRQKSGGIFIEHGVHFFDLFRGWFGEGRVVSAQRVLRPGTDIEEQVQCTVRFENGVLFNMYHGFTQPGRMDRQETRVLFERGDLTLEEWVPVRGRLRAVVNEEQTRTLTELFPEARLDILQVYGGKDRAAMARHRELDLYQMIEMKIGLEDNKMKRYGELLRSMLNDQISWIADRSHKRVISEENGRTSLAMALEAARLSEN